MIETAASGESAGDTGCGTLLHMEQLVAVAALHHLP